MSFTNPNPVIQSVTASATNLVTAVAALGLTDGGPVETWWEVDFGLPVVFGRRSLVVTTAPQTITDTAQLPQELAFVGKSATFHVAAADRTEAWVSAPVTLNGPGFATTPVGPSFSSYRLSHRFTVVEAFSARGAPLGSEADPLAMEVRLTDQSYAAIETIEMGHPRLWRVSTGVWLYQLDPLLLAPGQTYVANFRFAMTPGNFRVERQAFVFQPAPVAPRIAGNQVLVGTFMGQDGVPASGQDVIVEIYKDIVTMSTRTSQYRTTVDAFGSWWVEVPMGSILRVIKGDHIAVLQGALDQSLVNADTLAPWQPSDFVRVDSLGYPLPGQNALFGLGAETKLYPDGRPL